MQTAADIGFIARAYRRRALTAEGSVARSMFTSIAIEFEREAARIAAVEHAEDTNPTAAAGEDTASEVAFAA